MEPVPIISVVTEKYSIFSEDQRDLPSNSPQICTLRGPASQKYSVPGKPGRLGALIQIPSLGKYVILCE